MTSTVRNEDILYKLGKVEQSVENLGQQIVELGRNLEKSLEHVAREAETVRNAASERMDRLDRRVTFLENWKNQLFTRLGFVVSGVSLFWIVLGGPVERAVATLF